MGIMPLGLATIAALTPAPIEVDIWDESIDGPLSGERLSGKAYDLAGVTGYVNHAGRVNELGRLFSRMGVMSAVGGPGVSSEPEHFRGQFDVLFIGEAEYTWPRFLADLERGAHRREYRQVDKVDMAHSPMPRWDHVAAGSYLLGSVQTTRGCPFDCEFCDVIYIYGRQARHKPVERVLEEVRALERLGIERLLFCDDNFIGNRRYAKELLQALIAVNASFRRPMAFFTNVTLNIANDERMLALMADAGFCGLFIGVESPNVASLVETNKPQNYSTDMVEAVKKVHAYGIVTQCGMIVGFDHDDATVFDQHFAFLQETGVPVPMVNLLKAPTGTRLWVRLHKEGRVFQNEALRQTSNVEPLTNVTPRQMPLAQLLAGYLDLVERLRDWARFEERVRRLVSQVRRRPVVRRRVDGSKVLLLALMIARMRGQAGARRATLRLLWHTLWRAPFMVERVMGAAAYQYQEALRVPRLKAFIAERIRQLTAGDTRPERERAVFFIPDGFRKAYPVVFPDLYRRVHQRLHDKSRVQDALVEVTSDFLTRWGRDFGRFEEHHRRFLEDICDRTIDAENGSWPGQRDEPGAQGAAAAATTEASLRRLAADVLRSVEQDLRSLDAAGAQG